MLKIKKAQSLGEYVILVTIVIAATATLFPMIRRGTQSLLKAGSDQLGDQSGAEQDFNADGGYTNYFDSASQSFSETQTNDLFGEKNVRTYEETTSTTNSLTHMGFTKGE